MSTMPCSTSEYATARMPPMRSDSQRIAAVTSTAVSDEMPPAVNVST